MNLAHLNGQVASGAQAKWSLAIAALTLTVQNGIVMAFGVLYLPLVGEFGGSRAEVAVVQSLLLLLGGFSGPLVGHLLDRFGPRRLFQLSAAAGIGCLFLMAASGRTEWLFAYVAL